MKKLLLTVALLFGLASVAQAALVGPVEVEKGLKVGYGFENSERDLDNSAVSSGFFSVPTTGNELEVERNSVDVRYGLTDNIGVFVKFGEQKTDLEGTIGSTTYALDLDDSFFYGVGVETERTLTSDEEGNADIVGFAQYQYLRSEPDIDGATIGSFSTSALRGEAEYTEHQVAVGVKKELTVSDKLKVTPYAGVDYQVVELDADASILGLNLNSEYEAEDNFGGFAGAKVDVTEDFSVNGEGHFGNEDQGYGFNIFAKLKF